jgi:hypothetical protein
MAADDRQRGYDWIELLTWDSGLVDPAAADDLVPAVEDGGLAGSDGALRLVEESVDAIVAVGPQCSPGRFMAMANLDLHAEFVGETFDGNPVEAVGVEFASEEFFVRADDDAVRVGVDGKDVARGSVSGDRGRRDVEALALADGEVVNAGVLAEEFASRGDKIASGVG